MKKLFLALIVACTVVGAASAQEYMSIGLGYASDTFNEDVLGTDWATKVGSLCISLEGFSGDPLGFFTSASFGIPTSGSVSSGGSTAEMNMDAFSTKMHVDCVLGLGYRFVSGEFDFIVAGGAGFSSTLLTPVNTMIDPLLLSTLGPGGALSAAYNMSDKYAFYASVHGFYGVVQISNQSSYYTNSVIISPAAGLRIRIR